MFQICSYQVSQSVNTFKLVFGGLSSTNKVIHLCTIICKDFSFLVLKCKFI